MSLYKTAAQGLRKAGRKVARAAPLERAGPEFLGELKAKGYLGDYVENQLEAASAALSPKLNRFLNRAGDDLGPVNAFARTHAKAPTGKANTAIDHARLDEQINAVRMEPGIANKRGQLLFGDRGGDIGPGENPIRRVRPDDLGSEPHDFRAYNRQVADKVFTKVHGEGISEDPYKAIMQGNPGPVMSSNAAGTQAAPRMGTNTGRIQFTDTMRSQVADRFASVGSNAPEGFADLMKGGGAGAFGSDSGKVRMLGGKTAFSGGDFRRSQSEIWQGRARAGLAIAGVGLGAVGAMNAVSSIASNKPAQLAVSGPSEGFGEEDNLSNAGYSSSQTYLDPRSFRTIGPMSPNRMGASGQLPLALHNLRRG